MVLAEVLCEWSIALCRDERHCFTNKGHTCLTEVCLWMKNLLYKRVLKTSVLQKCEIRKQLSRDLFISRIS